MVSGILYCFTRRIHTSGSYDMIDGYDDCSDFLLNMVIWKSHYKLQWCWTKHLLLPFLRMPLRSSGPRTLYFFSSFSEASLACFFFPTLWISWGTFSTINAVINPTFFFVINGGVTHHLACMHYNKVSAICYHEIINL